MADLLPGRAYGALVKTVKDLPTIFINRDQPVVWQNFWCAHELGHYFERQVAPPPREKTYSFIDVRPLLDFSIQEFFANEFALNLLIPEDQLSGLVNNPIILSEVFGVPQEVMLRRLEQIENRNSAKAKHVGGKTASQSLTNA